MKTSVYFLCCLAILATAAPSISQDSLQIQQVIDRTRIEFCPEPRLNLFNVHMRFGNEIVLVGETSIPSAHDSLIARLKQISALPLIDRVRVLPDSAIGERSHGIIQISTTNMRRKPSVAAEIINQGIMGETVRILDHKSFFYLIQLADGYLGWAITDGILPMTAEELSAWEKKSKSIFIKNCGSAYSNPSPDSYPVCDLVRGAVFVRLAEASEWTEIEVLGNRRAFVPATGVIDLQAFQEQSKADPQKLVHTASQFLGIPYYWGGRSTKGFDCSGFTHTVFRLNGITLPRDANMQVEVGFDVAIDSSYNNLLPGDLLFFGRTADRITHVGMYIGDKRFIHSDGFVRCNSFDPNACNFSDYRVVSLQRVKRIL
ncbi:MAG TPA: C40 family peptidase [bacterium]|nr:C40 family peptidase [bacterium]HPG44148.1 C40 family peptidase [bacterium]HPM96515.1 C40 family peptidase [bacterium]